MNRLRKAINVTFGPAGPALFGNFLRKAAILLFICAVTTVLFFPSLTFYGFNYNIGDVAVSDVRSPVEVNSGGIAIKKGEVIVRDGQVVTATEMKKFGLIESAVKEKTPAVPAVGFFVFTAVIIATAYYFASRNIRKFASSTKDLVLLAAIFSGVLVLLRLSDAVAPLMTVLMPSMPSSLFKFMLPVAVGAMLVRLILNSETALVFAVIASVAAGFFLGGSVELSAYYLAGGIAAAMGVRHCTHRSVVIKAGLLLGVVNTAIILSFAALKGAPITMRFYIAAGFLNGLMTAVLAMGVAPVLESIFRYTTNIKLLELSRMDHPLLRELAVRAPGTYHHSIVIGSLAEAAAESINANPLLARVSAYYHDVGKMKMPQYFIENISEENRHDDLTPRMSALILISHIRDGIELAEKHRLGVEIRDIISQHHGTSLVTYFYEKARALENGSANGIDESEYRYPGPKPQTKEAGIVMLADAIEAASKTIAEPTAEKLQSLTKKIVNRIFADGQLDECELTLKDLHLITGSFNRVFAGIYHQRVDYPEPDIIKEDGEFEVKGDGNGRGAEPGRAGEDQKNGGDRLKKLGTR